MNKSVKNDIDEGVIVMSSKDDVKVVIEYLGEGWNGDYNSEDATDEPLVRFSVYYKDREVDDASYCTSVRADREIEYLKRIADLILEEVFHPVSAGYSVKKLCESLSWIS